MTGPSSSEPAAVSYDRLRRLYFNTLIPADPDEPERSQPGSDSPRCCQDLLLQEPASKRAQAWRRKTPVPLISSLHLLAVPVLSAWRPSLAWARISSRRSICCRLWSCPGYLRSVRSGIIYFTILSATLEPTETAKPMRAMRRTFSAKSS